MSQALVVIELPLTREVSGAEIIGAVEKALDKLRRTDIQVRERPDGTIIGAAGPYRDHHIVVATRPPAGFSGYKENEAAIRRDVGYSWVVVATTTLFWGPDNGDFIQVSEDMLSQACTAVGALAKELIKFLPISLIPAHSR